MMTKSCPSFAVPAGPPTAPASGTRSDAEDGVRPGAARDQPDDLPGGYRILETQHESPACVVGSHLGDLQACSTRTLLVYVVTLN